MWPDLPQPKHNFSWRYLAVSSLDNLCEFRMALTGTGNRPVLLRLAAPLLGPPVVDFMACQVVDDPVVLFFRRDLHNSKSSASAALFT